MEAQSMFCFVVVVVVFKVRPPAFLPLISPTQAGGQGAGTWREVEREK